MKIAISSQGKDLDSTVDPRFGRCQYLLLIETDDMSFEVVENPYVNESSGVGSRLAALVASHGAKVVLANAVGPNAKQALDAAGIDIVLNSSGTVRQAVEAYKANSSSSEKPESPTATPVQNPAVEKGGRGGLGMGRGRGRGGLGRQHRNRGG